MKKILFVLSFIFSLSSYSQTISATFSVDMSLYGSNFSTVDFFRGGVSYPMTNISGNIFSYTTNVPPFQATNYTYKFMVDGVAEEFIGTENCIIIIASTDTQRVINLVTDTPSVVCWQSCELCIIYGCTDSTASNFNINATIDDGSCITCLYGCMDSLAINYDSLATCQDNSCIYPQILGCTDSLACNFNPLANLDDGTCGFIIGCIDTTAFNFDSLATCSDNSCVYEYNVTFQLDLRGQTTLTYTIPEVNGMFNGWCGNCAAMTDLNNDSIWEITIPILEGTGPSAAPGWEYKFSADNWNIEENLFPGDPCTFSASGYTNRFIEVTGDTILDPVCWQSCGDCFILQTSYNVTFQVDMSNVTGFTIPEVNGEFNNWCGNCWPMTDANSDNIWEFTTLVDTALQEFKFSADTWSIQENLDSNLTCISINYDQAAPNGWGYVNRNINIFSDTILDPVCWEDCFVCTTNPPAISWDCIQDGCVENIDGTGQYVDSLSCIIDCQTLDLNLYNSDKYKIYPNPTSGKVSIHNLENMDLIIIYSLLGEMIFEQSNPESKITIDLSNLLSDIYFIEIHSSDKIIRQKLIKL